MGATSPEVAVTSRGLEIARPACIAIIGCGAMGSLFGALLARAGHVVWMVDNHPERARVIADSGITVEEPHTSFRARVNVGTGASGIPTPDYVFFFVKVHHTAAATETAATFAGAQTAFVTLQNGLGNIETIAGRFGAGRVVGGTTAYGATEIGPGHIRHAGIGPTILGEANGRRTARTEALAEVLRGAGFDVAVTDDLDAAVWSKLAVNCGINAVGALTRLRNGAVAEDPDASQVLDAAVTETAAVAGAKGIRLAYDDPRAYAREVCRATAQNINSMLQDVLRQRRTEVDALNGAVAREAQALGVPAPVNAALAALVGVLERNYQRQVGEC